MTDKKTTGNLDRLPCPLCGEHCIDDNVAWFLRVGSEGTRMAGPCVVCGAHIETSKIAGGRLAAVCKAPGECEP